MHVMLGKMQEIFHMGKKNEGNDKDNFKITEPSLYWLIKMYKFITTAIAFLISLKFFNRR